MKALIATWAWHESRDAHRTCGAQDGGYGNTYWDTCTSVDGYWAVRPCHPKKWVRPPGFPENFETGFLAKVQSRDGSETFVVCQPLRNQTGLSHYWRLATPEDHAFFDAIEDKSAEEDES